MAHESLYEFPDQIKEKFMLYERIKRKALGKAEKEKYVRYCGFNDQLIEVLVIYKDTVLKPAKFQYQRRHCQRVIDELKDLQRLMSSLPGNNVPTREEFGKQINKYHDTKQ